MAGLLTKETNKSVEAFINSIDNSSKKEDCKILLEIMEEIAGCEPKVWGDNFLIGFGKYSYTRKGGKEKFEWFNLGFAPRKRNLTVYLSFNLKKQQDLLNKLGKCKWGSGCLYINKLSDIDLETLKTLIQKSKEIHWNNSK